MNQKYGTRFAGFSLVELLVVIGIIALVISILLPALSKVRENARTTQCLATLRQFGHAHAQYANDERGWSVPAIFGSKNEFWPAPNNTLDKRGLWFDNDGFRRPLNVERWVGGNGTAGKFPRGLICPSAEQALTLQTNAKGVSIGYSYGYNSRHQNYTSQPLWTVPAINTWNANTVYAGMKVMRVRRPTDKILFADSMTPHMQPQNSGHYKVMPGYDDYRDPSGDEDTTAYIAYRHGSIKTLVNVVFWDGHAETLQRKEIVAVKDPTLAMPARRTFGNWTDVWQQRWDLGAR